MLRRVLTAILACFLLILTTGTSSASPSMETEDQKLLYALGLALSQRLTQFDFNGADMDLIEAGLRDGVLGNEHKVDLAQLGPKIDGMMQRRAEVATEKERVAGKAFCEAEAAKPGAQKTESGVVYFEVKSGEGPNPSETDTVLLHYHGTLRDGTVFDSSVKGGEPVEFALNAVIGCFSEGVRKMRVGGKAKLVCPNDTAYGDRGAPPMIPPGAAISFDVELLGIVSNADASSPGESPN